MTGNSPRPCPFCGGNDLETERDLVCCRDCAAEGPLKMGCPLEAVAAWNYRFEQQEGEFPLFSRVRKIRGYRFPGTVVAVFETLKGKRRYVVECSVPEVDGILHIYSERDLEEVDG